MNHHAHWLLACILLLFCTLGQAAPLELTKQQKRVSLEGHLEHFADAEGNLDFAAVRQERFDLLPDLRSLGYGSASHWFRFEVGQHHQPAPERWVLNVGSPELEEVDIWVENPQGDFTQHALGYHRPYANRPYQTRLFSVPVDATARTQVYLRVRTHNAINVNAELLRPGHFVADETHNNFYAGLYFGILLIAVAFYSILGAWLRDVVMAAYAGYIASRILFTLGTSGYLPALSPLDAPWLVDIIPRLGWLGGSVFIVLMWGRLLELRRHYPLIHRLYQFTIVLNLCLLPFALIPALVNAHVVMVVKLANHLNSLNFYLGMLLALLFWWRSRQIELMVYFIAFIIPALATQVNTLANQGLLPQNLLTSNLYQLSTLVHVLVMSIGLALRLRQVQQDKVQAQQAATITAQRAEEQRRFVAMLSHEFRNPLAAIDRSAQMIGLKLPQLVASEERRLEQIRHNVATLSGLVDNFLLSETLDHGMRPNFQPCAIGPLLEQVLHILGEEAGRRTRLEVTPPDASFALDPNLIGMAISNLIDNALRYSPPDSRVEIRATNSAQQLSICVADRGPAMTAEEIAQLGQPYYRAESSLGKKGSGLGLYFTRNMVEAHGGRLLAHARPGGGMELEVRLC